MSRLTWSVWGRTTRRAWSARAEATGQWLSPHTAAAYPSGWLVELPEKHLVLTVTPQLQDQELYFPGAVFAGPTYWEGAVDVHANGAGSPTGVGYVELTGYAQPEPSSQ